MEVPVSLIKNLIKDCSEVGSVELNQWNIECNLADTAGAAIKYHYQSTACNDLDSPWDTNPQDSVYSGFYNAYVTNRINEYTAFGSEVSRTAAVYTFTGIGQPGYLPDNLPRYYGGASQWVPELWNYILGDQAPADLDAVIEAADILGNVAMFFFPQTSPKVFQSAVRGLRLRKLMTKKPNKPAVVKRSIKIRPDGRVTQVKRNAGHNRGRFKSGRETKIRVPSRLAAAVNSLTEGLDVVQVLYQAAGGKKWRWRGSNWTPTTIYEQAQYIANHYDEIQFDEVAGLLLINEIEDRAYARTPAGQTGVRYNQSQNQSQMVEALTRGDEIFDASNYSATIRCLERVNDVIKAAVAELYEGYDHVKAFLALMRADAIASVAQHIYGRTNTADQRFRRDLRNVRAHMKAEIQRLAAFVHDYIMAGLEGVPTRSDILRKLGHYEIPGKSAPYTWQDTIYRVD